MHYILNLEKSALLFQFFDAHMKNPMKGNWIFQVLEKRKKNRDKKALWAHTFLNFLHGSNEIV